jgi:hypothetical protein
METYSLVRFFQDPAKDSEVLATGLPLEAAHAHCNDPESSSMTAVAPDALARTATLGPWFDGYSAESV